MLSYTAPLEEAGTSDMLSCDADMHAGRAMVGRKDSALALHDLASGKLVSKVSWSPWEGEGRAGGRGRRKEKIERTGKGWAEKSRKGRGREGDEGGWCGFGWGR